MKIGSFSRNCLFLYTFFALCDRIKSMITKSRTIPFSPFSEKHKRYIRSALRCRMSVAEGAIRSGKTIDHCIIAAAYLETTPDKIHLASGSTIANAKMNIGDCNGFGLEHLFRGRCRWGKYKDNEALYIYPNPTKPKSGDNEKIVIFAGGGKADSYKKILGNSYGLWIATEINQHYDSDASETSFIKVAFGRQVAAIKPLVLWDLNPSAPTHKIYSDYIDKFRDMDEDDNALFGGFNYQHFTIADNLSITPERRAQIEAQYDTNSIWYRRDIKGQRCVAEGIIYRQFADSPEKFTISPEKASEGLYLITIGVDFGGSGSATTFVATGFTVGFDKVRPLMSWRIAEELNPVQLNAQFASFCDTVYARWGKYCECFCDSAEQILIRGLKIAVGQNNLHVHIRNARKNAIIERIRLVNSLIAQGRLEVSTEAETVKDALCEAVWDSKHEDTRLDDGTSDIDTMDAFEYSIEPFMRQLIKY